MNSPRFLVSWLAAILCLTLPGRAAPLRTLDGHVPEVVKHLRPLGQLPATKQLRLTLELPLRDQAALGALLQRLYDPASPDYHNT
jgi:hypothetical protein